MFKNSDRRKLPDPAAAPQKSVKNDPMVAGEPARWEKAIDAFSEAGGICIAEVEGPNNSELRFYVLAGGQVRIIQTFHGKDGGGFEIYKPVSTSNRVDETISAALKLD